MGLFKELIEEQFNFLEDDDFVANFGWITEDNKLVMANGHACHYMLNDPIVHSCVAIVSQTNEGSGGWSKRGMLDGETERVYYHWLLNESPMGDIFLSKDIDEVFDQGYVVLSPHFPRNTIMAACIMSRHLWETVSVTRVWMDLVKAGLQKDAAFVLAHTIFVGNGPFAEDLSDSEATINMRSENSNHTIFNGYLNKGTLTNFINHEWKNVYPTIYSEEIPKRVFRQNCSIGGLFTNKLETVDFVPIIKEAIEKYCPTTKMVKDTNPFAYPRGMIKAFKYGEVIQAVVKAFPEILEEDKK